MGNVIRKLFRSLYEGFALWRKLKTHTSIMEALRMRIIFSGVCAVIICGCITYRLADIMIIERYSNQASKKFITEEIIKKADIVDRNGELLATSITTASCYADPSAVIDADEIALKLSKIKSFPSFETIKKKLKDKKKHFVWISRHVTPQLQEDIMSMGLPGIHFQKDYKRVYVHGNLFSHVIGCTDIDGNGVCGIEKNFSKELLVKDFSVKQLVTSLDLRIQTIVHEELSKAIEKFDAVGGNAILMSTNGEVIAMVSLPDFDSNDLRDINIDNMFNRNTLGAFEQGSILKILNVAIALDSGSATLGSVFDASAPIRIGRFSIKDFRGKNRPLTLAEAFVFSSNIASAKIAQNFGIVTQKEYMKRFGMLEKISLEIPEIGRPIVPHRWTEATCMSVSYGYGLAVTPLQLLSAVTSIVNEGTKITPTLLYGKRPNNSNNIKVVSAETSAIVRDLMRAVVVHGTAKKASINEVEIFGKTGTAYKMNGKGYGSDGNRKRITTFLGGFPKDKPKYMLLVSIDDPKATKETYGYATAGWNVAPAACNIFERIVPILVDCSEKTESPIIATKFLKLDK